MNKVKGRGKEYMISLLKISISIGFIASCWIAGNKLMDSKVNDSYMSNLCNQEGYICNES